MGRGQELFYLVPVCRIENNELNFRKTDSNRMLEKSYCQSEQWKKLLNIGLSYSGYVQVETNNHSGIL